MNHHYSQIWHPFLSRITCWNSQGSKAETHSPIGPIVSWIFSHLTSGWIHPKASGWIRCIQQVRMSENNETAAHTFPITPLVRGCSTPKLRGYSQKTQHRWPMGFLSTSTTWLKRLATSKCSPWPRRWRGWQLGYPEKATNDFPVAVKIAHDFCWETTCGGFL